MRLWLYSESATSILVIIQASTVSDMDKASVPLRPG